MQRHQIRHLEKCRWITRSRWITPDRSHVVKVCDVQGGGQVVVWARPGEMIVRGQESVREAEEAAQRLMRWISGKTGDDRWVDVTIGA